LEQLSDAKATCKNNNNPKEKYCVGCYWGLLEPMPYQEQANKLINVPSKEYTINPTETW
jgi:hypothetical protein